MPRRIRRAGAGRRGRPSALESTPTADLKRELERRRSTLQDLINQRDALNNELQELESIFSLSAIRNGTRSAYSKPAANRGRPAGSGRRSRNGDSLVQWLQRTLDGTTLSVSDASEAVKKAGYKSKSANFRVIVNQALLANRKLFRKVGRGQYTAK